MKTAIAAFCIIIVGAILFDRYQLRTQVVAIPAAMRGEWALISTDRAPGRLYVAADSLLFLGEGRSAFRPDQILSDSRGRRALLRNAQFNYQIRLATDNRLEIARVEASGQEAAPLVGGEYALLQRPVDSARN